MKLLKSGATQPGPVSVLGRHRLVLHNESRTSELLTRSACPWGGSGWVWRPGSCRPPAPQPGRLLRLLVNLLWDRFPGVVAYLQHDRRIQRRRCAPSPSASQAAICAAQPAAMLGACSARSAGGRKRGGAPIAYARAIGKPPPSCSDVNIRASPPRKLAANVMMLSSPVLFACARTPHVRRCAADRGDAGCWGRPHPEVLDDLRQARGDCNKYVEVEHRFYDCRRRRACGAGKPGVRPARTASSPGR